MDLAQMLKLSAEYLSEYVAFFFATLTHPVLHYRPLKEKNGPWLNPKLLSFVVISILVGSAIKANILGKPDGGAGEFAATAIVVLVNWMFYGCIAHAMCLILQGRGTFGQTMSVALQLLSVLYVVSIFAAFVVSAAGRFAAADVYFFVHSLLLVVYLPLTLKDVHRFTWGQVLAAGALVLAIPLIGVQVYKFSGISITWTPF